jgi:erythromycin esterase
MVRSSAEMFAGAALRADASVRERFMADSVRRLLEEQGGSDSRIVLAAHNNHIQKTPVAFAGSLYALPMGRYLAAALGEQYFCIALTSTDRHVPEMSLDAESPVGFKVSDARVGEPETGSVEAAITSAGRGEVVSLLDVRGWHGEEAPLRIRTQSSYMETPVAQAFDAIISMPAVTMDNSMPF